jgi:cysteine desulfurase family protein (TIGR01976 family)
MLDVEFVRSLYPVLHRGEDADWALFENAGGSVIPEPVLAPFREFLEQYKVQPYAPYKASQRAGIAMDRGYEVIGELLGAGADEITIGPSTTLNMYVLAQAIRSSLRNGDEIIVTNQDHEANIGCWRRLESAGAVVLEWRVDPESGELEIADLRRLLSGRTRLVCFTLCSNIVGSFHDIETITTLVRDAGALSVGDGVSYAPHKLLDVRASGLDFFCFSSYKTFAPHTGVMWGRRESLEQLEPQGHYFNKDLPRYRMNPTGPLHAEIGALAGLGDYFGALYDHHFSDAGTLRDKAHAVYDLIAEHEQRLATQLLDYLRGRDDVRIIGRRDTRDTARASTIAFTSSTQSSKHIATRLAEFRIGCSSGHFYARRCVEALGIDPADGVVRISMVHYNTTSEVERLIAALDQVLQ